ncbi:ABC transporter C family member 10-like [Impatiens glandulifera]|uniref:ABC transporter C family member 10-like n=1 Tax=Impatiens glandulifera TaxID=253017 RepID=UPI001FB154AC|nr:ABC transporter C family member 10-like [Impatiens glandulifera]
MCFLWINPLIKTGKNKTLEEKDIPNLRNSETADQCYSTFMKILSKHNIISKSNILLSIYKWQRKDITVSALFAFIKVITIIAGPLLLNAFIKVAEGGGGNDKSFVNEPYVLAAALFVAKMFESLSERQWVFKTKLIGLRIRSCLSAAIYSKQLRLSNAAKSPITNYVMIDVYKIADFPYWFHQIWTTPLMILLSLLIIYSSVKLATVPAFLIIVLFVFGNYPIAKIQHKRVSNLATAQDSRLKAVIEGLTNVKVLKLYGWENHFKKTIERLRLVESNWLSAFQHQRGYHLVLFWSCPVVASAVAFWTCYLLKIPINASKVFTFLATLRILQEPIRLVPEVASAFIEANIALTRISEFLQSPELQNQRIEMNQSEEIDDAIVVNADGISWDVNSSKNTLSDVNLTVKFGEKVAVCGEVGSGKSTLLAAILGEVELVCGSVSVNGNIAFVSQMAWIQTGTIRENILFGSEMVQSRYEEVLEKSCLVKDLDMLPNRDLTVIGERGVNLSGGQKQRVQLARALYENADVYLLDDPFSAVDAHTAASLFNEYVMQALSRKTVLLVTSRVDFLPAFDSILLISNGRIAQQGSYDQLITSNQQFQNLVNAHHKDNVGSKQGAKSRSFNDMIEERRSKDEDSSQGDPLIRREERESGDNGFKPYLQYFNQKKGFFYLSLVISAHSIYIAGQLAQNIMLAIYLRDPGSSIRELNIVYTLIGLGMSIFLLVRSYGLVILGLKASNSIFSKLMTSLFGAPMSFFDSTPLGRILSRVASDMNIVDLELGFKFGILTGTALNILFTFGVLFFLSWPVLFIVIPIVYVTILLQRFYFASSKELMRIEGTTKSSVACHLNESISGAITIRAFGEEERFFSNYLSLIDANASPSFHNFSSNEWLIQRLEILCAAVLSSSALALTLLNLNKPSNSGFIGMTLVYGLSLNIYVVLYVQSQCMVSNAIVAVERLEQYTHIQPEGRSDLQPTTTKPPENWPSNGRIEIFDLKIRYHMNSPLVLRGINCLIEGGSKVGIVGRTGSGKTTLISALFRLVEPTEGRIVVDNIDISSIGLHDLRSHMGIIPQEPTLFSGSVRFNLDPLSEHTDHEIWEVLEKCQLKDAVQEKENGLDCLVIEDGSNWSMGQRQLFCMGRALLKRRKILVLDEATASIDNATDLIIQRNVSREFADCTVLTVAHKIPTVIDYCNMVIVIDDGEMVEYDEPKNLMNKDSSYFAKLVKEYYSHNII